MPEFTMPSLGADMEEGTLLEWLVSPGEPVTRGDVIAVVETAKSTIEIECFATGTVQRLLVEPGTTVPVGGALAVIAAPATGREGAPETAATPPEPAAAAQREEAPGKRRTTPRKRQPAPARPATPPTTETVVPPSVSTPLVRHLAKAKNIDLATVRGTGPGGRITRSDIEAAPATVPGRVRASPLARRLADELHVDLAQVLGTGKGAVVKARDIRAAASGMATPEAKPGTTRPGEERSPRDKAAGLRQAIATLMSRSKREIPHYYLSTTVDLTAALEWMHEHNRRQAVTERLVPAALLLKAVALAMQQVPELNGFWKDGQFVPGTGIHLGVAVSLRGGILAPVLSNADALAIPELMAALKDVVSRARTGRLRDSQTADPTITVTNLGDQGVEAVFGVIYPPQVALVGFGRVMARPWAVDGLLGVRQTVTATLSADHRASDGAVGARFLTTLDRLLQQPEEL